MTNPNLTAAEIREILTVCYDTMPRASQSATLRSYESEVTEWARRETGAGQGADAVAVKFAREEWSALREDTLRDAGPTPADAVAYKFGDPTEDARWITDADEAREIAAEDPSLIVWVRPYRCMCGEITGERCAAEHLAAADLVIVEHMPAHLRAGHEAAGTCGTWPHNGARRLAVHRDCAALLADEWTETVAGDVLEYVVEAQDASA